MLIIYVLVTNYRYMTMSEHQILPDGVRFAPIPVRRTRDEVDLPRVSTMWNLKSIIIILVIINV